MAIDYSGQDWRLEDDREPEFVAEPDAVVIDDVEEFEYDLEWDEDEQEASNGL